MGESTRSTSVYISESKAASVLSTGLWSTGSSGGMGARESTSSPPSFTLSLLTSFVFKESFCTKEVTSSVLFTSSSAAKLVALSEGLMGLKASAFGL